MRTRPKDFQDWPGVLHSTPRGLGGRPASDRPPSSGRPADRPPRPRDRSAGRTRRGERTCQMHHEVEIAEVPGGVATASSSPGRIGRVRSLVLEGSIETVTLRPTDPVRPVLFAPGVALEQQPADPFVPRPMMTTTPSSPRPTPRGLWLFGVYLLLYARVRGPRRLHPGLMAGDAGRGLNLAVLYGMGLIVAAVLLAFVYMGACRRIAGRHGRPRRTPGDDLRTLAHRGRRSSALFVAVVLGLSFVLGAKAKSTQGYFAAHGQIHWFVNGVAFAGDYLSAASFLGICGMIAFYGYDGFLYSIGYLAGWIVALFVIAEPIKRLGKFTFADALDDQFHSRGIKLAAAHQHPGRQHLLPDPADGRRRRAGPAAAGLPALGGRDHRRRGRDPHRRHRRDGLDDLGPVHQGGAARLLLHRPDRDDPPPRPRQAVAARLRAQARRHSGRVAGGGRQDSS